MDKIPYEDEFRKEVDKVFPKWVQFLLSFEMCGYVTLAMLIIMYLHWFGFTDITFKFSTLFKPLAIFLFCDIICMIVHLFIYFKVLNKHNK